jgi:glutamate synthase (NADPH/NADH) small chain
MSATGFLEYDRALPAKSPVEERKQHHREFIHRYEEKTLHQQASRCMDCGVPFCHNGCPLGNVIPEFNEAVRQQHWQEAFEILSVTNPFPEFTGRICPAPCESSCVLGINEQPVAIEEIEKHIIEIAFEKGYVKARLPNLRTGKKIAVIGSGPAGLAAAAELNARGHAVTVFERDDAPGGLLRYGIPDFKLEKWVLDRRLQLMEAEGIVFRCHAFVGVNIDINDLLREFHAIVLAGGSTVPRDLPVPGRETKGIHFAMEFLRQQNKWNAAKDPFAFQHENNFVDIPITAHQKNVIVIGGGDTGSDCVGTANRQGALSVTQLELLPMPPSQRDDSMPWPLYPMLLKSTSSHEEGCDRIFSVITKAFIPGENGQVTALRVADINWQIENGQKVFKEIPGTERDLPCELVLLAMGFIHPLHEGLIRQLSLDLDARGNVQANEKNYQASIPKIFVAGDMRRGQSLVVWAIKEGRDCAAVVDAVLQT